MPTNRTPAPRRAPIALVFALALELAACQTQKPPADGGATWDAATWDAPAALWK